MTSRTMRLWLTRRWPPRRSCSVHFLPRPIPPHIRDRVSPGAVTDQGQACGDPLSWEFTGEVLVTRFFDNEGNLVRIHAQIRESGTITNLATGEVVDLPRTAFLERVLLVEDGSIIIQDAGLSLPRHRPRGFLAGCRAVRSAS